jgi:hypothetical protein
MPTGIARRRRRKCRPSSRFAARDADRESTRGPGARWVYTLYVNQNEYFVHALDTARAQARCLDLDWHGDPNAIANGGLALRGKRLAVVGRDGDQLTSVSLPAEPEAAGWRAAGWTAIGSLAALAAAVLLFLRGRTKSA